MMKQRMRILDWVLLALALLGVLTSFLYLAITWKSIPALVPTNYDFDGTVNTYSGKGSLFVGPGISLFLDLAMFGCMFLPPSMVNLPPNIPAWKLPRVLRDARTLLFAMMAIFSLFMTCSTICSALAVPLPVWLFPALMVGMFAPVVIFIFRIYL